MAFLLVEKYPLLCGPQADWIISTRWVLVCRRITIIKVYTVYGNKDTKRAKKGTYNRHRGLCGKPPCHVSFWQRLDRIRV